MTMDTLETAPDFPLPATLMAGHHFSTVYVGNSMYPTFRGPDLLYVRRCGISQLATGDVIVFHEPGCNVMVTHRVIAMRAGKVRTRGDNNRNPDPWTLANEGILGKVVCYQRGRKLAKVRSGMPGLIVVNARRSLRRALFLILRGLASARDRIARTGSRK
jgi:signal peptidase I